MQNADAPVGTGNVIYPESMLLIVDRLPWVVTDIKVTLLSTKHVVIRVRSVSPEAFLLNHIYSLEAGPTAVVSGDNRAFLHTK